VTTCAGGSKPNPQSAGDAGGLNSAEPGMVEAPGKAPGAALGAATGAALGKMRQ